ncbi:unnamed protein product [Knipowitschia caucasica]
MLCLPLVAALLLHSSQTEVQSNMDYKHGGSDYTRDYKDGDICCGWKCMLFTLQWPGSFCQFLSDETLCHIPSSINYWTIHGLWPYKAHNCCHCWPLFYSDIKELETNLTKFWPSFLKITTDFQFWTSEWFKHGVCAACVEGLNSASRYFHRSLQLYQEFNVTRVLHRANITPSWDQTYEVERLRQAVRPLFGNHHEIQCFKDKQGRELLFQMKISLFPNGTKNCSHSEPNSDHGPRPCPPNVPLYYLPINQVSTWSKPVLNQY